MSDKAMSGYGGQGLGIWWEDLRDVAGRRRARAYARHGFLNPPPGSGKLVWVKAAGSRESVLTAVEVLRAIHAKRLDVRLALTFEHDYPRLLRERVKGLTRTGIGYGPCDAPRAVRRILDRFSPLGVIVVRHVPPECLMREVGQRDIHSLIVNAAPAVVPAESVYPLSRNDASAWRSDGAGWVSTPADLLTLLVEAQVEPNFRTLISPGEGNIWWFQAQQWSQAELMIAAWRDSEMGDRDLLFVGDGDAVWGGGARRGLNIRLSSWDRRPVAPGSVVLVDEHRWLPALSVSCDAVYLAQPSDLEFWQALAGGAAVSVAPAVLMDKPDAAGLVDRIATIPELLGRWRYYTRDVQARRRRGDAMRRFFWEARREAAGAVEGLLQRVYDW